MKLTAWVLSVIIIASTIPSIYAENLDLFTDSDVYSDGQPLYVYGKAISNENLILRLFAPDGTIVIFDQIIVDSEGTFNHVLLTWPEASTKIPYGTY
ncbi:MAG: methyl-accepting chemotaxis protein, partial [Nitrosopumilaceae archaeon]